VLDRIIAMTIHPKAVLMFATTIANALLIGIATKALVANSAALLYSITRKISPNNSSVSRIDESAYLVTDKDIYRCQHCTKNDTLTPKFRQACRQYPDDYKYHNFCSDFLELAEGVQR